MPLCEFSQLIDTIHVIVVRKYTTDLTRKNSQNTPHHYIQHQAINYYSTNK